MPLFPFYWKANSGLMMPISLLKSRVIGARPGIYTQACLNSRHRDSPHLRDFKKKKKKKKAGMIAGPEDGADDFLKFY